MQQSWAPRFDASTLSGRAAPPVLLLAPLALAAAAAIGWWVSRRNERREDVWLRRMVISGELDPEQHEVLAFIRKTLLGLSRRSVRRLLGSPSAAGEQGLIVDSPTRARQQVADIWYYRLDRAQPASGAALVVEFDDDRAREASFLAGSRK